MKLRLGLCLGILLIFLGNAGIILFTPACKPSSSRYPEKLLLIIVDTVRADHLSCYGYKDRKTPNIDGLAESGVLFSQAVSAIPETGPSVSSILTACYPARHGVRANVYPLPKEAYTWAQVLRKQGFRTAAFTDKYPFRKLRILKGFDHFHRRDTKAESEADVIASAVDAPIAWLKQNRSEKFFALIHFYDAHLPYAPFARSESTLSLQYSGPYDGQYGPAMTLWDNRLDVNAKDVAYMRSLYDDEIGYIDRYVGEIQTALEEMGIAEETLIILTSDHGEAFGEHNYYFDHGDCLYEHQIWVPLIFKHGTLLPPGLRVEAQVRTIDIMPTALQLMNIDFQRRIDGVSLAPLFKGKKSLLGARYAVSEGDAINFTNPNARGFVDGVKGKHISIRKEEKKLIYVPQNPDGEFELYDLNADPDEKINLIQQEPGIARELLEYLRKWIKQQGEGKTSAEALDKDAEEILKSLGYIR